jgi:predicted metal-binding protein
LEREIFLAGYHKAFLLFTGTCRFCEDCISDRALCKEPLAARPTAEAMAVDVFATVRPLGYPIDVLSRYDQPMNRYAFLLIE